MNDDDQPVTRAELRNLTRSLNELLDYMQQMDRYTLDLLVWQSQVNSRKRNPIPKPRKPVFETKEAA